MLPPLKKKNCLHFRSLVFIMKTASLTGSNLVLSHPVMLLTCTVEWVLLLWDLINLQIKHWCLETLSPLSANKRLISVPAETHNNLLNKYSQELWKRLNGDCKGPDILINSKNKCSVKQNQYITGVWNSFMENFTLASKHLQTIIYIKLSIT